MDIYFRGWKIYKRALLPSTPPHQTPNLVGLNLSEVWKKGMLFIRYTTNFDCGYETGWWWIIKDDDMDISKLNKKKRYEITSSLKINSVRVISPREYAEKLYAVYVAAIMEYKNADRPIEKERFILECLEHEHDCTVEYYGVFDNESDNLAGYAVNVVSDEFVDFKSMKFDPKYLSKKISAALIYVMVTNYLNNQRKPYISDGERSIRHISNFQDYLIKYFGFRKAYCQLNIIYNPILQFAVRILYPIRKYLRKIDNNSWVHNILALLNMEELRRNNILVKKEGLEYE